MTRGDAVLRESRLQIGSDERDVMRLSQRDGQRDAKPSSARTDPTASANAPSVSKCRI